MVEKVRRGLDTPYRAADKVPMDIQTGMIALQSQGNERTGMLASEVFPDNGVIKR